MSGPRRVRVVRSGGITGMRREGEVDLDHLPAADAVAWRQLLDAVSGPAPTPPGRARPDGFGYRIVSEADGIDVTVPEQQLPERDRRLLERAVRPG